MRENFYKDRNMGTVPTNGPQVMFIVEILCKTRDKDLVFTNGMRVDFTKDNGVEIEWMDLAN